MVKTIEITEMKITSSQNFMSLHCLKMGVFAKFEQISNAKR